MKELTRLLRLESIGFALIGLIAGMLMIAAMFSFSGLIDLMANLFPNILLGITGLFLSVYFFSIPSAKLLYRKKINPYLLGFIITILSLESGTFTGALLGYFTEGIGSENGLFDYIFKPVLGILFWGCIPVVILSVILGFRFSKLNKKYHS